MQQVPLEEEIKTQNFVFGKWHLTGGGGGAGLGQWYFFWGFFDFFGGEVGAMVLFLAIF
jgi:hypothetical protein